MSEIEDPQNKLARRDLLCGAVTLAACSLLTECGYNTSPNSGSTSGAPPASPAILTSATLAVTTSVLGTIPVTFMGLSYEKTAMSYSYFHASNHNLIGLFRLLGKGVLRIGGGSVDEVVFSQRNTGSHLEVTPSEITALAAFLEQTGWQCLYGVNFAASTPALAAQEAAYVVSALGPSLIGIEIGNEPDEYSISGRFFVGEWTFELFLARWELFRVAIVAAAPNAPITGPASGGGNHITSWTLPFGQAAGAAQITLLTQHYYRLSGGSPAATAAFLISTDAQLVGDLKLLNAGALTLGIPYRLSECNSFYNGGAQGVSNSYAASLWVIDFLFTAAANNAAGVNMHGGGNQPGYTPIADNSGGVVEARPEYYGMLFFTMAGSGALLETRLSAGSLNVTAYAVRNASGTLNIVIVNKEVGGLNLLIETNQTLQKASLQVMLAPALSALSGITIQGSPVNKDGTFAPQAPVALIVAGKQTSCSIPALSAALISIT